MNSEKQERVIEEMTAALVPAVRQALQYCESNPK